MAGKQLPAPEMSVRSDVAADGATGLDSVSTQIEPRPARVGSSPGTARSVDQSPVARALADRYELGPVLGHGGVGTVYRARDLVLHRDVAVKLFRPDAAIDQAGRYEHEARLLASLSHPGLVAVFDAGLDAGVDEPHRPYLVMELVEGMTLARCLDDGPVPVAEAAAWGAQLATALGYVHSRGVVHRDVKPANILLAAADDDRSVTAKLTDFGIARLVDSTRMTVHGMTLGTPNYLSPEQTTGGEVGPPSDIYSLGLVLLECITGQVVYPGQGVEAAVVRLHRPPSFPPWLDPQLAHLLAAMTHPDPLQRPTALEAATALVSQRSVARPLPAPVSADMQTQVLRVGADSGSTQLLPSTPHQHSVRGRWIAAALAGAALLVVLILAAAGTWSAPSTPHSPAYPSVPGQLGTHLQQLQKQVQP